MARAAGDIKTEITGLEAKLKARRGKPGFRENVRDIEARLTECREELANAGD